MITIRLNVNDKLRNSMYGKWQMPSTETFNRMIVITDKKSVCFCYFPGLYLILPKMGSTPHNRWVGWSKKSNLYPRTRVRLPVKGGSGGKKIQTDSGGIIRDLISLYEWPFLIELYQEWDFAVKEGLSHFRPDLPHFGEKTSPVG